MDETGTLEYGQVYVRYTVREDGSGEQYEDNILEKGDKGQASPTDTEVANSATVGTEPGKDEPFVEGETKVLLGENLSSGRRHLKCIFKHSFYLKYVERLLRQISISTVSVIVCLPF